MSDVLRVSAVVGSVSRSKSKTRALVDLIVTQLSSRTETTVEIIELHTLIPGLGSALTRHDADTLTEEALRAVESADLLIAATPVFHGSYTGLFKHFFDLVEQYALAAKPVLLVATGGSERHALVIDFSLRPLFGYFQAWTAPMGIYLSAGDFDGTTILNPEVYERIEIAIDDVIPMAWSLLGARQKKIVTLNSPRASATASR